MVKHDDSLEDWADLEKEEWPTLLIGNGLSINLWGNFQYSNLFSRAHFKGRAKRLFNSLGTSNFEIALQALYHAHVAGDAVRSSTRRVDKLYDHVKDGLFETVAKVHVPWSSFPSASHVAIADELRLHRSVFTTNYDLCLYWSYLEAGLNLKDFFWNAGNTFNRADTSFSGTAIYYLALHS